MKYEVTRESLEDLKGIVELNTKIFKGMYEREPYTLEEYQSRLADKNPLINIVRANDTR
jgi:hypothetical protein